MQRDQLTEHELTVERLEKELENHRKQAPDKSSKNLVIQNHHEKETYLSYEVGIPNISCEFSCSLSIKAVVYPWEELRNDLS